MFIIKKITLYKQLGHVEEYETYFKRSDKFTNIDYLEQFLYGYDFNDSNKFVELCKMHLNIGQFKNRLALLDTLRMTL